MRIYKVYNEDNMGFESDISYIKDYSQALRTFNELVKKELKEVGGDLLDKFEFSNEVARFKEAFNNREIISRNYPYIQYKFNNMIIAHVLFWERTSYEYEEYEIISTKTVLEAIEVIENA